jgi:D-3-phosphoglycerate dehydrogenase
MNESSTVDSLVLDLLEWIGAGARPYGEVMEAWRTSCPRLPVWETANELGLLARGRAADGTPTVSLTPRGQARLHQLHAGRGRTTISYGSA